jgi:hypothetical protein
MLGHCGDAQRESREVSSATDSPHLARNKSLTRQHSHGTHVTEWQGVCDSPPDGTDFNASERCSEATSEAAFHGQLICLVGYSIPRTTFFLNSNCCPECIGGPNADDRGLGI